MGIQTNEGEKETKGKKKKIFS